MYFLFFVCILSVGYFFVIHNGFLLIISGYLSPNNDVKFIYVVTAVVSISNGYNKICIRITVNNAR